MKPRFEDYTEAEFLAFVTLLFENDSPLEGRAYEAWKSNLIRHFEAVTEHPDRLDVICFPPPGSEDSPEGVVKR
ncbi:bacteriocin immunity protein, partial [Pseudomonas huaxiensis]|uniref:bacteriocin immunity protein n=1 Tax=Pseudomonas huaxiensis TaxID=2213017 RepID=UPI002989C8AC